LSEGGGGRARCQGHKCVPRLRGTRKGGAFAGAQRRLFLMSRAEARAIYAEKHDEWCVLRLGCWLLVVCCWLFVLKIMI